MGLTLHVGFHKTGTTWLQRHVFPHHPGVQFLDPALAEHRWWRDLATAHDFDFDPVAFGARARAGLDGRPALVSWEGYVGDPLWGADHSARTARRLGEALPGTTVVVVLRDQAALIESLYRQYVHEGGTRGPDWLVAGKGRMKLARSYFRYDRLLQAYEQAVGRENLHVLLYEDMKADRDRFVADLWRICGAEPAVISASRDTENVSLSRPSLVALRWANRLLDNPINTPPVALRGLDSQRLRRLLQGRIDPWVRRVTQDSPVVAPRSWAAWREEIATGNSWVARRYGLALGPHGYLLAD